MSFKEKLQGIFGETGTYQILIELHEKAIKENTIQVREQCARVVESLAHTWDIPSKHKMLARRIQRDLAAKLRALNAPPLTVTIAEESPNNVITPADLGGWQPMGSAPAEELCGVGDWKLKETGEKSFENLVQQTPHPPEGENHD